MLTTDTAQTLLVALNLVFLVPAAVLGTTAVIVTLSRLVGLIARKPSQPAAC